MSSTRKPISISAKEESLHLFLSLVFLAFDNSGQIHNIQIHPLRMINRLRQNNDNQWRTSQQLASKPVFKSPQRLQEESYNLNPAQQKGQENENFLRNAPSNNLKGKPLISPKKAPPNRNNPLSHRPLQSNTANGFQRANFLTERSGNERNCSNHPAKRAEFMVMDDNEDEEFYCGRCAAQLATRGCDVIHLESNPGMRLSKKNELPHFPQYEHEPIYQEILEILSLCNGVISDHNSNIERFAGLEQEYQQQLELTTTFYDRLIEIIEEMKTDHLYDLATERDKYTQIADIENDHLRENIIEINGIKNDIENHLEEVLEGIRESGNEAECRESLEHYRQKLTLFNHQIEEQMDSLKEITRYPQSKIDNMIEDFQNFLKVLWDSPNDSLQQQQLPLKSAGTKNLNSALTVKNIHQILPRGVNNGNIHEGKRAFRNLEQQQEQEQPFEQRKSPNFKKI